MNYKSDIGYRKQILTRILNTIIVHENEIVSALKADFNKPEFETVVTETSYVISDLKNTIKNISTWAKPKSVFPFVLNIPSSDTIYKEPYGKVLVISPWNYPFQLALCPVIAAVAAGNQVVLKPSELTPNTAAIIHKIISEVFPEDHVSVIQGNAEVATQLLEQRWDYIFFTGSVAVGKIVAQAAAKNLTPVTLELGGKNPCIVDETANLQLAAKRIVWGKFVNCGQTCIAPDYILVHQKSKSQFINYLKAEITNAYGENPEISPDFARIINTKNWTRLVKMIEPDKVIFGGQYNNETNYLAPTLIEENNLDSLIMQDEIFGPILPIVTYTEESEIDSIIARYEKPLGLYIFSERKKFCDTIIAKHSFGGGCINDTMIHFSNKKLPFGGVGHSGIGAYHGKLSFDIFSHHKGVVKKATWIDLPLRYAPYKGKLATVKKILNWL
ncbi:aldehyde dehydrogenase [Flavobacterium ammonificans]|uniref:Aldehyde dehydrogenase n=1 Tax=Flavobacterium ammonificans TaxID=1751056 RepID=A0ABM7V2Q5_9FLAO|nr:aldehyde dehydrogenase [Flavobacterium ammonificans]BDB53120.1 aldehyde dehydrogenase [Flavobacterium ammonificans]